MKRNLFAIRDRVAMMYRDVICDDAVDVAVRNLRFAVNNNAQLAFMAKDLEFCRIGEFDTDSGVVTPVIPADVVCHVGDLVGDSHG